MQSVLRLLLICLLAPVSGAFAQDKAPVVAAAPAPGPLSAHQKFMYGYLKMMLLRSAEKMSDEQYNFKPAAAVRTYGQILGHVADWHHVYCAAVLGDPAPPRTIEQTKTIKADLVAALKDALTYCDKAYNTLTDATAADMVKLSGRDTPKLGVLTINIVHATEHYGNLVTYMRMNDIVPPTSEPGFLQPVKKQ